MESSLQSNRQGRPRRGSEHHVPPHSIILVRCIVYIILHMLSYTMACTSCLQARLPKGTTATTRVLPGAVLAVVALGALHFPPAWVPAQTKPNPPRATSAGRRGQMGLGPVLAGQRRGGQSCRPALLSRHHDISLRRGQRPRHRRKQPSQDRA